MLINEAERTKDLTSHALGHGRRGLPRFSEAQPQQATIIYPGAERLARSPVTAAVFGGLLADLLGAGSLCVGVEENHIKRRSAKAFQQA
ncbi:hypothetical protein [Streptomyces buecherae]|uniref:hypothetical protein n=1 Tax=Streptomyces buecherae TaxID=2763006 RepID=UPI003788CBB8